MVMMTRIEPETNTFRYYRLQLLPNLFGGISLIRHWGRIGARGQQSIGVLIEYSKNNKSDVEQENSPP